MKIELIMKHLNPLSNEEFMELHREAWENGWVYGPGFDELYDDYLVNWVFFVDYIDYLIKSRINKSHKRQYERKESNQIEIYFNDKSKKTFELEDFLADKFRAKTIFEINLDLDIFIGEAPPYWPGKYLKNPGKRSYFYNPKHLKSSPWFTLPLELYNLTGKISAKTKIEKLSILAQKGFLLIDIFPFPIIQDTQVRKDLTGDFSNFLNKHFKKKYTKIIEYIYQDTFVIISAKTDIKIKHALAMPIYGCLQIAFGPNSRKIMDQLKIFESGVIESEVSDKPWEIVPELTISEQFHNIKIVESSSETKRDRYEFIRALQAIGKIADLGKHLAENSPKIPMLIAKGGGLSLTNFINSVNNNP